jgi:histidinol-phosphate aminotransferase
VGRDLKRGIRLDRNERVTNFEDSIINKIYKSIPQYILSAYPDTEALYEKLSKWLKVNSGELYIINGITEGIRIVFETLVNPKDKVVVLSPTYPMYKIYAQIYQATFCPVNFKEDLTFDKKELLDSIDKHTVLVCLPNPNLPIESLLTLDEIRQLAEKCKETDTALVIDEAYTFFGSETAIPLIKEFDNIIIFQTFSKAFGLAGIRLGYMVSREENIEYLSKTRSLVESNGVSMKIAEYMLEHPGIMNDYVKNVKEGSKYVKDRLKELGFRFLGGDFTNGMLIFLENKKQTEDLLNSLKAKKIYIRGSFEYPIENCLRLTLGPKAEMEIFIKALSDWKNQ